MEYLTSYETLALVGVAGLVVAGAVGAALWGCTRASSKAGAPAAWAVSRSTRDWLTRERWTSMGERDG